MDAVSYAHSAKQAKRIKKFIENPDSNSGIVTVPKVIGAGESVTIPTGRVAVLPNVQVDGTLNIEGEVFIPTGATFGDLEKGLLPIGAILNAYTIFDNCIVAFGGEFNRADYPKLWAYLQANPALVKTELEWTTENTTNGMCGFFSDGNGTTTFRVPNLDKAFLRPDSRGVGSFEEGSYLVGDAYGYISVGAASSGLFNYDSNASLFRNRMNWDNLAVPKIGSENLHSVASGGIIYSYPSYPNSFGVSRPKNIAVLPLIVAK